MEGEWRRSLIRPVNVRHHLVVSGREVSHVSVQFSHRDEGVLGEGLRGGDTRWTKSRAGEGWRMEASRRRTAGSGRVMVVEDGSSWLDNGQQRKMRHCAGMYVAGRATRWETQTICVRRNIKKCRPQGDNLKMLQYCRTCNIWCSKCFNSATAKPVTE